MSGIKERSPKKSVVSSRRPSETLSIPGGRRHRLMAIEDKSDNRISLHYREGMLTEVVECVGRVVDVVRDSDGNIERFRVADPVRGSGRVTLATFHYDARGNLVAATDADGGTRSFPYDDEDHLMTSPTSPTGLVFCYRYDRQGRCVESWGEARARQRSR